MSTDFKPVKTSRMGQVSMTQFAGGKENGRCLQLTASTPANSGQKDMFQAMQFTKGDAFAIGVALMEWACDRREEE